jgi:membrane protein implicated in regulation of membrane protease activity
MIWKMLSKPTFVFWLGAAFIIFEILIGIAHLTEFHIPRWEKYVIYGTSVKVSTVINYFFIYITLFVVVSVMIGYGLIRKKQSEKFMYRHE